MVVMLVSLPLLLRGLGAEAFGTWVLLQTFSAVNGWLSLADAGVGIATTRLVSEHASLDDSESTRRSIASGMTLFLALGFVGALAVATVGPILLPTLFNTPDSLVHALRVATVFYAMQIFIEFVTEGAEACLEGLQRVDVSRAVDAVRRTCVAAAACTVANTSGSLSSVAAASCAGSIVGLVAGVILLRRAAGRFARPSFKVTRGLMRYGRTVAILQPLGVLHRTMDRIIVGAIIGPEAVTLVEIATQLQTGAEAVLSATSYAVVPSASWLQARADTRSLRDLLELGTKYSLLATSGVVAMGVLFAAPFVHLWVKPEYHDAAGLAMVALLYVAVTGPIQVGSNLLVGIGRAGEVVKAAVLAVLVNLIASVILVHAIGIVGCFIGSLIGTIALVPLLGRASLRASGSDVAHFLPRSILPSLAPVLALVLAGLAVIALPLTDTVTLIIGVPVALAAFALTASRTSLSREELRATTGFE